MTKPSGGERRIIYYVAASADGFIARRDGDVSWLEQPRAGGDYGMGAFYKSIDTVVMGSRTWEGGRALGKTHFAGKKNYVFTRRRRRLVPEVDLVDEGVASFAARLRTQPGKNIWLVGGGALFGSFLDAGQVDAIVIHVIPVLLGEGIGLIAPRHRHVPLQLDSSKSFPDGVVRVEYSVSSRVPVPARSPEDERARAARRTGSAAARKARS